LLAQHHGNIFKECVGKELHPYMWDMANFRERCAWTTDDRGKATKKAKRARKDLEAEA